MKINWVMETGYVNCDFEGEFEVDDDTCDEDIEEMVQEEAMSHISWSWWKDKCCKTCEHWESLYQQCENGEQTVDEAEAYMSPPTKYCELWEKKEIDD